MSASLEPPFILVADDDADRLASVRSALRLAGAQVAACRTAKVALEALSFHMPNVLVVAPAMERGKGWDVVYAARRQGNLPTIVLDGNGDDTLRRTAFTAGVDDVMTAPLAEHELALRAIGLAGRVRHAGGSSPVYRHRDLVLDVAAHSVAIRGHAVRLTAQQFAILRALFEANGATLGRDRLLARIASLDEEPPSDRAIDLHVTRLRRRLCDDARRPRYVEAVYGVGYRLAATPTDAPDFAAEAEQVLESLPDPLLVIDGALSIRFANEAAARFLARPRDDLLGQSCSDVLRCRDCRGEPLEGARCLARAVVSGDTTLRDVPAQIAVGDDHVPVEFTYARVHSDGLLTLEIRPRREATTTA